MGKKSGGSNKTNTRVRVNPLTGQTETVNGTKAGKRRTRLPFGHELRTHDLRGTPKKKTVRFDNTDD